MKNFFILIPIISIISLINFACEHKTEYAITKKTLLATETVIPGNYGNHDTLDYQLIIHEDSTYTLSYKKHIQDSDNIYGGEIHTDYHNGIAQIKKDSIFLTNDTLQLVNGYVEFIKNGKVDFVRKIDSTTLTQKNTYDIKNYPKYHIIHYETWTTDFLRRKKEFKKLFNINDETLFEIELLAKDTVDKIMPKTKIVGESCCYYSSYYKKVLPYIDQNGHKMVKLFLSLEKYHTLEADLPMISDGAYYFLEIDLNLTKRKITWIGLHD